MDLEVLKPELIYKAVRSSGSGGQNVNKVATKVELYFHIENSLVLSDEEKEKIAESLKNRINKQGVLMLSSDESRSQLKNKNLVTQRFIELLTEALKEEKERKPTKIPKSVKRKRLENKRKNAEKKSNRKPPKID